MVRGHSYLKNDRDFALIEKRKKSSTVLLPEDWAKVIEGANLRNPFKVTRMKQGDFKSWKTHLDHKYCLQKKDTDGNPVRFHQIHRFNIGWGSQLDPKTGESVLASTLHCTPQGKFLFAERSAFHAGTKYSFHPALHFAEKIPVCRPFGIVRRYQKQLPPCLALCRENSCLPTVRHCTQVTCALLSCFCALLLLPVRHPCSP